MRPSLRTALIAALLIAVPAHADLGSLTVAANEGYAAAQIELASKYENSEGIGRDYALAAELYCRAAKQGSAEAQFKLGWMYANARGIAKDDGLAAYLFNAAAAQGHEYAQRMLQFMPRPSKTPACLLEPSVERNVFITEQAPEDAGDSFALDLSSSRRQEIAAIVRDLAPRYSVDPGFALAIIAIESNFKTAAVSRKNAQGLMQLIPDTQRRFQVKNAFNPVENIKGGLAYLQWLLAFFKGNVALVAAAYNAGERAVEKHRGIPPFPETQNYVRKVKAIYKKSKHPYVADLTAPSSLAP